MGKDQRNSKDEKKRPPAQEKIRETLPGDTRHLFDILVEEYRFYAVIHHGHPFVSYKVLAELIRTGWRPSARDQKRGDNG